MLLPQKHVLLFSLRPRATSALLAFRHRCLFSNTRFTATATATAAAASLAASASPVPFAVEDYLVAYCHLTPAQAVKASKVLSRLKSPTKPEAVSPSLPTSASPTPTSPPSSCTTPSSSAPRSTRPWPRASRSSVTSGSPRPRSPASSWSTPLASAAPPSSPSCSTTSPSSAPSRTSSRRSSTTPTSSAPTWRTSSSPTSLSSGSAGWVTAILPSYASLCRGCSPASQAMVARAEDVGVARGSAMFRHALLAVAFLSKEKIAAKVEFLKKTFRWSEAEVAIAVAKLNQSFYTAAQVSEKVFVEEFMRPHQEAAPRLAQDHAATPTRFR